MAAIDLGEVVDVEMGRVELRSVLFVHFAESHKLCGTMPRP